MDLLLLALREPTSQEVQTARDRVIDRRLEAYDQGDVQAIDGEKVMAKARRLAGG